MNVLANIMAARESVVEMDNKGVPSKQTTEEKHAKIKQLTEKCLKIRANYFRAESVHAKAIKNPLSLIPDAQKISAEINRLKATHLRLKASLSQEGKNYTLIMSNPSIAQNAEKQKEAERNFIQKYSIIERDLRQSEVRLGDMKNLLSKQITKAVEEEKTSFVQTSSRSEKQIVKLEAQIQDLKNAIPNSGWGESMWTLLSKVTSIWNVLNRSTFEFN